MRRLIWSWWIVLGLTVTVLQTVAVTLPIAEEGTSVILECTPHDTTYTKRAWYPIFLNESNYPPSETVLPLFVQMGDSGNVTTSGNRTDMSVDNETFALTIGRLRIHDDGYFTCATEIENKTLFNDSYIQVYIQPNVTIDGLDKRTLKGNDTITVSCHIDRVFPKLLPTDITIFWGEEEVSDVNHTEIANWDGSYRYNVWTIRNLTKDDDGVAISCTVTPQRGKAVNDTRIISVMYAPSGSPRVLLSKNEPNIHETIEFVCYINEIMANPAVSYILWYINGSFENTSTDAIQMNVSREDKGNYSCRAGNSLGLSTLSNSVFVRIKEAPYGTLTLLVSDNHPKLHDTLNLTCNIKKVTAYPEVSNIHWYKDKFKIRTTIPAEHLIIRHMDINGTGNYSCTVNNSLGESLHSDAVEVIVEVIVHEVINILVLCLGILAIVVTVTLIIVATVFFIRFKRKKQRKRLTGSRKHYLPKIPQFTNEVHPPYVVPNLSQPRPLATFTHDGGQEPREHTYANLPGTFFQGETDVDEVITEDPFVPEETDVYEVVAEDPCVPGEKDEDNTYDDIILKPKKPPKPPKPPKPVKVPTDNTYDDIIFKPNKPPKPPKPVKGMLRKVQSNHIYLQPIP